MAPVRRDWDETHLAIEVDRALHRGQGIENGPLVAQASSPAEEHSGDAVAESATPEIGPHVHSLDLSNAASQSSQRPATDRGRPAESKNEGSSGGLVGARKQLDLVVEPGESGLEYRVRESRHFAMVPKPLPVLSQQATRVLDVLGGAHEPGRGPPTDDALRPRALRHVAVSRPLRYKPLGSGQATLVGSPRWLRKGALRTVSQPRRRGRIRSPRSVKPDLSPGYNAHRATPCEETCPRAGRRPLPPRDPGPRLRPALSVSERA